MTAKVSARALLPVPLIGVLVYCLYGLTATFGPEESQHVIAWRFVYAGGGVASLFLLILLLAASVRADARQRCE